MSKTPKPSASPAISDASGPAYSAAEDLDRLPDPQPYPDNATPPADLAALGYDVPAAPVSLPQAGQSPDPSKQAIDETKYSRDFGSPNGSAVLRADGKPTTLAEEKVSALTEETPEDLRVLNTHGQSFAIVDADKGKASKVRLGMAFEVVRKGCQRDAKNNPVLVDGRAVDIDVTVAICRIAGAFNANEATFGYQVVPGVLSAPEATHFAGIQAGDVLHFVAKGDPLGNVGRNPFEGTAT